MLFLYSTAFQTWKTSQLLQADLFTQKRLKFKSLLLCTTLEGLAIILREQISPPQIKLLDSTAGSSRKARKWSFMLHHLQRKVKCKAHPRTVWEPRSWNCSVKTMPRFKMYLLWAVLMYFTHPHPLLINAVWKRLKLHTSKPTKGLLQSLLMCAILKNISVSGFHKTDS